MELPPDMWFVFQAENFNTAVPRTHGDFTAEVMAQARPNGCVLDHWRIALGDSKPMEAEIILAAVIPAAVTLPKSMAPHLPAVASRCHREEKHDYIRLG